MEVGVGNRQKPTPAPPGAPGPDARLWRYRFMARTAMSQRSCFSRSFSQ
jgi:hypothetical protein